MNDKELSIQKNRIIELAKRSHERNMFCFTEFLGLAGQDVLGSLGKEISFVKREAFGGAELCERIMIRFGDPDELGYEEPFPITCMEIIPLDNARELPFDHRDILGSCMNLGITRGTLGDIFLKEGRAFIFCSNVIAPVLKEELIRIRHCSVKCGEYKGDMGFLAPSLIPAKCRVSSLRLDSIIAKLYNTSREDAQSLFVKSRVFINGRACTSPHHSLNKGDIVSVRGHGRFRFEGEAGRTKKDKLIVEVLMYG